MHHNNYALSLELLSNTSWHHCGFRFEQRASHSSATPEVNRLPELMVAANRYLRIFIAAMKLVWMSLLTQSFEYSLH